MSNMLARGSVSFVYTDIYLNYFHYLSTCLAWFESLSSGGIVMGSRYGSLMREARGWIEIDSSDDISFITGQGDDDDGAGSDDEIRIVAAVEALSLKLSLNIFKTYNERSHSVSGSERVSDDLPAWYAVKLMNN